jgi:hypothetical protein
VEVWRPEESWRRRVRWRLTGGRQPTETEGCKEDDDTTTKTVYCDGCKHVFDIG